MLDNLNLEGFEWDEGNIDKNWLKHQVARDESMEVFFDDDKIIIDDIHHSKQEPRYIIIGKTKRGRILYVSFTIRHNNIRVISARDINQKERTLYEKIT
ncbi:MAG: BrnT family toxin [Patescibacteria group bacterium]